VNVPRSLLSLGYFRALIPSGVLVDTINKHFILLFSSIGLQIVRKINQALILFYNLIILYSLCLEYDSGALSNVSLQMTKNVYYEAISLYILYSQINKNLLYTYYLGLISGTPQDYLSCYPSEIFTLLMVLVGFHAPPPVPIYENIVALMTMGGVHFIGRRC